MPSFVVAIYALLIFAVHLQWLPAIGARAPATMQKKTDKKTRAAAEVVPPKPNDSKLDGYRSDISGNRLKGYPKSVFGSSGSELFDWTAKRAELDSYYDNVDTVTTKEGAENPMTRSSG